MHSGQIFIPRHYLRAAGLAVVAAACSSLLAPTTSDAFLYWSEAHSIGRVNQDGSGLNATFIPRGGAGIAVNGKHIYWSHGTKLIGRADLDGSHVNRRFLRVGGPDALAVSATHIYWTNGGLHTIGRARLDGSGVQSRFIENGGGPSDLVVKAGKLYWSNSFFNAIGRANLDGTAVDSRFLPTGRGTHPKGLAIGRSHVYWVNKYHSIGRARLDGSGFERDFVSGCDTEPGGCPEYYLGLAVDRSHLYWAADLLAPFPDLSRTYAIGRANLDGSAVEHRFIVTPKPIGFLAVDRGRSGRLATGF
jgi:virginiamycin B lyase